MPPHVDLLLRPKHRLFKFQVQILAQDPLPRWARLRRRPPPPNKSPPPKNSLKMSPKSWKIAGSNPAAAPRGPAHARMSKPVIERPLLAIRQNRVRLRHLLELLFRVRIIRIPIRMVSQRQLAVSALDLDVSSRARNAQHLVIISFGISRQKTPLLIPLRNCHPERNRGPHHARFLRAGVVERGIRSSPPPFRKPTYFCNLQSKICNRLYFPRATRTIAGRSSRSLYLYPRCNSSST